MYLIIGTYVHDSGVLNSDRFKHEHKPAYQNKGIAGEIYLRLITGKSDLVMLCGQLGESLKHTSIKLDLHAAEGENKDLLNYSFYSRPAGSPPLVEWKHRKYVGDECTELSKVPFGKHIIGIERNETLKREHVSSIIHVIVWD